MSSIQCSLNNIPVGRDAVVCELTHTGSMRRRLQDIGVIEGTRVEVLQKSCAGDPVAYLIKGTVIALRSEDSRHVVVNFEE